MEKTLQITNYYDRLFIEKWNTPIKETAICRITVENWDDDEDSELYGDVCTAILLNMDQVIQVHDYLKNIINDYKK
jgi:hypothetical protein